LEAIQKIIKRAADGHESAQRKLYEQYRNQWYMLSLRYGKNKSQADDIFQEGLINIYKDLHQFDASRSAFGTWSSRVMINAALRYLKKYNWIDSFSDLDYAADKGDESETVYQKLAAKELTEIIKQLPLGYRLVFNMYAIEGFSHKEIADQLGITVGTSKSQLSKARAQLRSVLEQQLIVSSNG